MNYYCVYHNSDYDGECSAAIVNYNYTKFASNQEKIKFIGMNHSDEFPLWDKVDKNDTVCMVDFSLPMNDMILLNQITNLIWIDHHKSSIDEYNDIIDFNIIGNREIGKGACELTWKFLLPNLKLPKAVKLLSNFDVWKHTEDVIPFQYGLSLYDTSVENKKVWFKLFDHNNTVFVFDIIATGKLLYKNKQMIDKKYMKLYSFNTTFEGYNVIAVNRRCNSLAFISVFNKNKHQIMIPFFYNPDNKKWIHSIYTPFDNIDVSEIAKKYSGGGHKQAAGFEIDKPILTTK